MLLTVDPELLDRPIVAEAAGPGGELFPHLYGPLPVAAAVRAEPVDVSGDGLPMLPDLAG